MALAYILMAYIVMAYIVMAYIFMACIVMTYIVMAYIVMIHNYIVIAHVGIAHVGMAHIVMIYIVMAHIVMAHIVMAWETESRGRSHPASPPKSESPLGTHLVISRCLKTKMARFRHSQLEGWFSQRGYPVINVEASDDGSSLRFVQAITIWAIAI